VIGGGGAVVAGEVVTRPEPGDVADLTQHASRRDWSDTEQTGQARGCCGDRGFDLAVGDIEAAVDADQISDLIGDQFAAQPSNLDPGVGSG
jgi:hypothetical protein